MRNRITTLLAASAAVALLSAGAAWADSPPAATPPAPAPSPAPNPSMSATLSANPNPATFDAGPFGKLMVTGVLSGGGFWQDNPGYDCAIGSCNYNKTSYGDITNALAMVQKTDGPVQFFVAGGAYSLPALGGGYVTSERQDRASFGFIPEGFVKIVPNSYFSIEAGLLPTLVGDEYTFTFQNMNIQRGLLWNQENIFDKGVQVNFSKGPWALSASVNDGFNSGTFNTVSGLLTYTFKNSDTLTVAGSGAVDKVDFNSNQFLVPALLSNSAIYNLIYSHTQGPWTISPYIQYTSVANNSVTRYASGMSDGSGSTIGGALLVKYSITPEISIAARGEYISTSGDVNLLYGPKSNAWSLTVTPTYQKGVFFIRGEASYVSVGSGTLGDMFGQSGTITSQTRVMGEAGVIF